MTVSFDTTNSEIQKINKIVLRAKKLGIVSNDDEIFSSNMDMAACHCNDIKLDFNKMLKFDDFNFAHDFCGIKKHINRKTGKLENCFVPRCAVSKK